jgi:hypothetical protein
MACAFFQERVARRTRSASVRNIIPALPPARCVDSFPRCLRELLRRRGFNTPLVLSKALHHLASAPRGYAFRDYTLRLPDGYRCPTACKRIRSRILGTTRSPGGFGSHSHGWCWPRCKVPPKGAIRIRPSAGARDALTNYLAFYKSRTHRKFFGLFKSKSNQITDCYSSED